MFIEVGVVLFLLNIPHLSYLNFLFGDHVLYNISIIIPIALSIGYIYCVKGLAERSNLARIIAVVLLFIAMFSFPIGSIISVLSIAYLVYFERGTFQDFKKQNLPFRIVGSSITIIAVICILFMVGMISFINEDLYYSAGVSALEFDEDTDGTADVIILLKGDVGTSAIETQNIVIQNVINLGGEIEGRTHLVANTIIAKIDVDKLDQIQSDPNVKRVIPNEKIVRIIDFDKQPSNLRLLDNSASLINADGLYSQGITGKDIVVAVVDTGINEELSIFDRNGEDVVIGKLELYGDYTHWHGTACASCIASQDSVYPGIAPGSSILEVGVFTEDGYAVTGDILQGWEWVVNWKNANNKFVICSNSFGAPARSDGGMLSGAVDRMAFDYGIPMICAAGNTGPGSRTIETPALAEGALAVGSVNDNLDIASFSSRGPSDPIDKKPDVVALGVSINMFDSDGNHIMESGTSFSTPITAGAVALVAESHQDHGVKQFYNAFRRSAKDLGPSGFDYDYGYGLIDVTVANEIIGNEVPESTYLYLLSGLSFMGLGIVSYPEWRKRI